MADITIFSTEVFVADRSSADAQGIADIDAMVRKHCEAGGVTPLFVSQTQITPIFSPQDGSGWMYSVTATLEVAVTPEMIGAGLDALLQRCPDTATGDVSDQKMVAEIFKAMLAAKAGRAI